MAALEERAVDAVGRWDRMLFTLLLRTGMRLSAAFALTVEDVDLDEGVAVTVGKHARAQQVKLGDEVAGMLRGYLRDCSITSGPIFRARATPLSPRQAQYRFHAVVAAAMIERAVTVHSLRHTFATRLAERSGDLRVVQAALGHRQLATSEVYSPVTPNEVQAALSALP